MELHTPHSPPRLQHGTIERVDILRGWLIHRDKTCHLLLGPAGSGKTTLALQYRRHLVNEGFDVAWTSVHVGDALDVLMSSLFSAFRSIAPTICQETHLLYNRDPPTSSSTIAISLIKGIEHYERQVCLVVDDYHNITHPHAHAMLQTLLEYAPRNFHVLLLSRSVPPLSFERLRAAHQLHELDTQALRFSQKEVEEFLQRNAPGLHKETMLDAMRLTDGWAAGLELFALGIRNQPDRRTWQQSVRNVPEFNAYFESEVLTHLPPDVLEGLIQLSPARRFNAPLAVSILGAQLGHHLLSLLEKEHLFVMSADSSQRLGWWRFHPLFRELLLSRFRALPAAQQRQTYLALGQWFGNHGHIRDAAQHLVAANAIHQAATYIARSARTLFLNGELQRLVRAIAEVPRSVLAELHSLTLWLGWTQLCYGQLNDCQDSISRLEQHMFQTAGNPGHKGVVSNEAAHLCLLKFSLALQIDDQHRAHQLLPEMLAMQDQNDAVLQGGRRNLLAWFYAHRQAYATARQHLQGRGYYLDDGQLLVDSSFGSMMSASLLGLTYLFEGDFKNAEVSLRATLANAEKLLGRHCEAACNAAGLLAEVLYEIGDFPALHALLEDYFDAIERVALPDAQLSATLARSRLHAAEGHWAEAHSVLTRMEALAHDRQMLRVTAILLFQHVELALQASAQQKAQPYLVTLQTLAERAAKIRHFAAPLITWFVSMASAQWDLNALRHREAADVFAALASNTQAPKRLRLKAQALQAACQWSIGARTEAEHTTTSVLQAAQLLGLGRSLLELGPDFIQIVNTIHDHSAIDPMMGFYLDRVLLPMIVSSGSTVKSKDASALLKTLSERETEILHLLANALPNKRIAQALGISPETVKWHLKNIYGKLGVFNRGEAVLLLRHSA